MNKINKGYTLTVTSWENDADYYNTKSKTVATLEEAKVWYEMMQLCKSENNQPAGVIKLGNTHDGFNSKQKEVVKDFMKRHHKILVPGDDIEANEDNLEYWFCDLSGELLGHSEYYMCRVMESCVVTYSPVDVIPEIINL
jgi:hypothetical protein